ncbi:hypothetical protein CC86DRAFT_462642 [Ophiobolus disseminans]|uniref:Uncharacterized protein n=1 Tax=Ophiobolus disseminans TaxID=1469910 RepID=A0A6A7AG86_9PLEO|nr:hypothetical protein CC86DRAFT_462642 [Ophiobolus disseminans]
MAFQEEETTPAAKVIAKTAQAVTDLANGERKGKSKKDKKTKRESVGAKKEGEAKGTPAPAETGATPTVSRSKDKSTKKEKNTDEARSSVKKKRKRGSEVNADSPSLGRDAHNSDISVLDPAWLQNLKSSVGNIGAIFDGNQDSKEHTEKPSKKRDRAKRKSATAPTIDVGQDQADKPVKKSTENELPPAKKQKNKKDKSRTSLNTNDTVSTSNVQKTASPYASTPKKTPVPFPQQSSLQKTSAMGSPVEHRKLLAPRESKVLVTETPPSQMPREATPGWKTPIPFSMPKEVGAMTERKKSKTVSGNFATSSSAVEQPSSAPAALFRTKKDAIEPSSQDDLTSSNLLRYTAPLNDDPKPRPRARESSVSSASSMSIKDAFARMGKHSPTSSGELNPFFTPSSRKPKAETHAESSAHTFAKSFLLAQATVNFSGEAECLRDHLSLRATNAAAGPLPCLKSATGCNAKSEQVLRLMRDENSTLLKFSVCTDAEQASFDAAIAACIEAERFLSNAIAARVPVALGKLEGVYTLYCPKYAASHVDRYGFGQRTLSISRPSGFKSNSNYTARLAVPPSPVACTLLAFTPPPHASFRVTTLTTSAEGYTMGLVCLGNGYVLLRVDMGLLLTGKKSAVGGEGDVCMEFLGVRERDAKGGGAVKWPGAGAEELGEVVDVKKSAGGVEESPSKKKRGRPSNKELERRAREKEGLANGGV